MNFVSIEFFLIVILTLFLYFICPKKYRWYVLLASSGYFYIVASGKRAFLLATAMIMVTYISAIYIEKAREDRKKRKFILSLTVIGLIGILAVTKTKGYAMSDIRWFVVPLGVSYYTFSLVGYLVDVYSNRQRAEKKFLKLFLYTLYFPKIMQGPISKFRELGPKLIEGHAFDYQNFCYGLQRILWGYFKKLVIVERAAFMTKAIFDGDISDYSSGGVVLVIATIIATISHYCDFSGYMDIVIGVSQMMGIELDENFKQPFFSKTAAEFWRRWHITLGVWFKDYVYMALVINPIVIRIGKWTRDHIGKRVGKAVLTIVPLAVVWFLTGLWHGTGISYVLWGCYWGTIIILSNVFSPEIKKLTTMLRIKTDSADWKCFQTVRIFCVFMGGLLISTLVGYQQIGLYIGYVMKDFNIRRLAIDTFAAYRLDYINLVILIVAIVILWRVDAHQVKKSVRESIAAMNGISRWMIYTLLFLSVILLGIYGPGYTTSGFAYTHF